MSPKPSPAPADAPLVQEAAELSPVKSRVPGHPLVAIGLAVAIVVVGTWGFLNVVESTRPAVEAGRPDPRGFAFARVSSKTGEPVRYAACTPIHFVINPTGAPDGGVADARRAIALTAEATGMRFVYDGTTTEQPSDDRHSYQPDVYGDRWAPLLIAWADDLSDPADPNGLETIGLAGSSYEENESGRPVYVSGTAVFDADAPISSGFGGETWGQVMLHEIGHVVGLGHVEGNDSVMNPELGLRAAAWGPGDRAGLWELGIGSSCLQPPRP